MGFTGLGAPFVFHVFITYLIEFKNALDRNEPSAQQLPDTLVDLAEGLGQQPQTNRYDLAAALAHPVRSKLRTCMPNDGLTSAKSSEDFTDRST